MKITPELVDALTTLAVQFKIGAAFVIPEPIAALAEAHGNDGIFEVRCSFGVPPCIHFDHRGPNGEVTELFTVNAMTGAEIEKENSLLH